MREHEFTTYGPRRRLSQDELAEYFLDPELFKKVGTVSIRAAKHGEQVETIIDGKVETTNIATDGDVVVKGPKGEEYIIDKAAFESRYTGPEPTEEYQDYKPTGKTYAVSWDDGPIIFTAKWGEDMILDDGDFLCSPTEVPSGDLYRVEGEVFGQTYQPNA